MYAKVGLRRGELTLPLLAKRLGARQLNVDRAWLDGRISPFAVRAVQIRKSGRPNPIFQEESVGEISFAIDRLPVDLPGRRLNAVADRGRSPEEAVIARDTLAKLLKAALLTDDERKVVTLCYGLNGRAPQTQVEIAEGWIGKTTGEEVSKEWINLLHARALAKLKNARWEIDPAGELVSLIERARLRREIVAGRRPIDLQFLKDRTGLDLDAEALDEINLIINDPSSAEKDSCGPAYGETGHTFG